MAKIIKFNPHDNNENKNQMNKVENKQQEEININQSKVKTIDNTLSFLELIANGIEEHVLYYFAVKEVLGIDFVYKDNEKGEVGVLGVLAYEHKRKPGSFIAEFIAKGYYDNRNKKVIITELAFKQGEPQLYQSIMKTLKAKKILPQ